MRRQWGVERDGQRVREKRETEWVRGSREWAREGVRKGTGRDEKDGEREGVDRPRGA
ncbi:hypothetical protein chiPu_0025624, partial [Chiloscyllium punctatum]|nr:hypothetical protein [Chiloscyllium punctatum]